MSLKARDRVKVKNLKGVYVGNGTIININDFREESMKYLVELDDYEETVFCSKEQLEHMEVK